MDTLTEHEMEVIVQRLETLVTDLEHNGSTPTFYAFVLLAQAFAGTKKAPCTLTHIRRCLVLAHRVRAIRDRLVSAGGRWTPMHDVGEVLHAEATRLSSLYGVARPACRTARRALQQAFRVAFTQATGKAYQKYGLPLTATERTTITRLVGRGAAHGTGVVSGPWRGGGIGSGDGLSPRLGRPAP